MANYILAGVKMSSNSKIIKLCFFGPSGSGKSTVADIAKKILIQQNYVVKKVNVGEPLHQIQDYIYTTFNLANTGQDGPLLQFIAQRFETSLGPTFLKKIKNIEFINQSHSLVIINSDCRNNSYQYLKELGFKFIRVSTSESNIISRLEVRGDVSLAQKNHSVEQTSEIVTDYFLDNNDSVEDLQNKVINLLHNITIPPTRFCLRDLY